MVLVMSNFIINWWRSQQFKSALCRGDTQSAIKILQAIQKSGASFSWLEKLFRDKLQLERTSQENKREIANFKEYFTLLTEHRSTTTSPKSSRTAEASDPICYDCQIITWPITIAIRRPK